MAWPLPRTYKVNPGYRVKGKYWTTCGWHTGVDLAAPRGTPVYAVVSGTIRHRNYGAWAGKAQFAISPSPGQPFADEEAFYAHCLERLPDGTEVRVGQRISSVGSEGNSTGPHLHLERHQGKNSWGCGVFLDPMQMMLHAGAQPNPGWRFPSGKPVYAKYLKFDGHEQNPDRVSDSIAALQELLVKHGHDLPITGKYWKETDAAVRACQSAHIPPADQVNASFVGPKQWEHLRSATKCPYLFVPLETTDNPPKPPPAAQWFVPDSLNALLRQVNALYPERDRSADGTIGDAAHAKSKSEHNPVGHPFGPEFGTPGAVHAVDITDDESLPVDLGMDIVGAAVGDPRVWYVIHKGRIWSKTHNWEERDYTGSNPHNTHVHISLAADDQESAVRNEKDTSTWIRPETDPGLELPDPEPPLVEYITVERYQRDMAMLSLELWKAVESLVALQSKMDEAAGQ